ncbi:DNA polymerase lambda-like isoform X10 [Oryzias latipes]
MEPRHGIMKAFPKVKRAKVLQGQDAPPMKKKPDEIEVKGGNPFSRLTVYLLPAGIGNARCQIFQRQIQQMGGQLESSLCAAVTHVVVDDSMDGDRVLRLLKVDGLPSGVHLVKCSWLSMCISERKLLDMDGYSLQLLDMDGYSLLLPKRSSESKLESVSEKQADFKSIAENFPDPETLQTKQEEAALTTIPDTKEEVGGEEDCVSQSDLVALITGQHPEEESPGASGNPDPEAVVEKTVPGKWVCAQSSKSKTNNFNKHITDKLELLAKAYTHQGDKWRALGYSKAVNALKSYHKPVTSYQEACQIPGIGKRMADKIDEIMESGHLRKLDHIGEAVPVLELFTNIWGAGAKTAQLWYQQVREAVRTLDPGLVAVACGSYRRGKATCGDVDVLITHPDGKSHRGVFSKVLQILHDDGFLTDDLVSHEENGEQKKYMGVCRLPGHRHRRLDIIIVPYDEFACALLYFTGSAHFNRSMRALAKTKGMSLSEHSLNKDVVRQGTSKVCAGSPVPTQTEKDVFSLLGIPYREPHERDW